MQASGETGNTALKVLVVDPNAHIRRLIATLMGALGAVEVIEARTPAIATTKMLTLQPDLVVVDWSGDPTEVTLFVHRIRQGDVVDRRTPVLALVGPPLHNVLERAWLADGIIAKPISAIELIDRAGELVDEWRGRSQSEDQLAEAAE